MSFEDRLKQALVRGQGARKQRAAAEETRRLTEEELKSLHTQWQLELTERIEQRLKYLPDEMPGFRFKTIMDAMGWGAAVFRDDVALNDRKARNLYSRLELVIRKFAPHHVLELVGKATIKNKELFHRNYYQRLEEVDIATFGELIDQWTLEFAEQFARKQK
jgi:hypothetical protein